MDVVELRQSDKEVRGDAGVPSISKDQALFTLEKVRVGNEAGLRAHDKNGEKQRAAVTFWKADTFWKPISKKKRAFELSCTAVAIVHGTMDAESGTPATLLVYDFVFQPRGPARIKYANLFFAFRPREGSSSKGPRVERMEPTTIAEWEPQTVERTCFRGISIGDNGFRRRGQVDSWFRFRAGRTRKTKMTIHKWGARISGNPSGDIYGNDLNVRWNIMEDAVEHHGIRSGFRGCILLSREDNAEFECRPYVDCEPDFKTRLGTLFCRHKTEQPVVLDPECEPYNRLKGVDIDRANLAAVNLDQLWDWKSREVLENSRTGAAVDTKSFTPEIEELPRGVRGV